MNSQHRQPTPSQRYYCDFASQPRTVDGYSHTRANEYDYNHQAYEHTEHAQGFTRPSGEQNLLHQPEASSPTSRRFTASLSYLRDLLWQPKHSSSSGGSATGSADPKHDFYVPQIKSGGGSSGGMGNGASAKQILVDGEPLDTSRIQQLVPQLQHQVATYVVQIDEQKRLLRTSQGELETIKKKLTEKDREITHLKAEVDKLRSVLQVKVHEGRPDILGAIHEEVAAGKGRNKKQGVSGESSQQHGGVITIQHFEKDFR